MTERRRLERAERQTAALAERYAPKPGTYYARLVAMTYEQLEAQRAKFQKERDDELQKFKGPIPRKIALEMWDPGYAFDYPERVCMLVDHAWAKRVNRDVRENRLLYDATLEDEGRRRLDEEHHALMNMVSALNKRIRERNKWLEARKNGTAKAE